MLIDELTTDNIDFLTTRMHMSVKLFTLWPIHERDRL